MNAEEKALRREDKDILDIKITNKRDKKPFVFISYKSDDWKKVLKDVVFKLQKKYGLRVYFDKDFDDHSRTWIEQFQLNMVSPQCKAVLAFLSNEYYISYATLMEMMCSQTDSAILKEKRKLVIPVNIEDITNRDQDNDEDTGLGTETYPDGKKNPNWKEELSLFDALYEQLRHNRIAKRNVYKPQRYDGRLIVSTNYMEDPYLEKRSCKAIMTEIWTSIGMNIADGSNKDICESLVRKLKNAGYEDVFDESLIDPKINWSDFERTNKVSLDEPEKVISYNAVNHKTAGVNEITSLPSPSASANDLRSKLIEKLGGDEVKSKAVFWIKDNIKFRLRSTTSTINNNKPNEQYDYLICEIKGKYGVFSSKQERDKITAKELDLNFDGLIEKIKEKLEEAKNGNRICHTTEVKDDKNGTISSAPQEKDDKDITSSPALKVIDDKCFAISGKALNDYKHLAEVFYKTYEKVDPKRIECFTAQMANSSEKLVWELNKQNVRSWMLTPQQNGYPHKDIPEGELLTAIETLASNFRSINKYLREIPLNYDSLFDCTGTDYELICKERDDRSNIGKGNVLVTIRGLESVSGNSEIMKNYLRPSDVGFSDMLDNWTVEAELDKEYQAYLEACSKKLCSITGFVRIVPESSILDSDKDRIPKEAAYGDAVILDGVKFLTFSEWSKDDAEEFVVKFREALGSKKEIKSITWNCGTGEKPVLEHIYGRIATDGKHEFLIRERG